MKKYSLFILLLAACLVLSSCGSGISITENVSSREIPAREVDAAAPIGDAGLSAAESFLVYYPSYDGISLSAVEQEITFSSTCPMAENIVRAMIAFNGSGRTDSLGGGVKLSLYGSQPVEVSRDTVTIYLGASALQLDRGRLYLVGQAFANTLCQLDHIDYVNLLVAGKAVGVDTANSLPMGSFTYTDEKDINALYKQKLARRVLPGEEPADGSAFPANVTLYYPLRNLNAVVCDTRTVTFQNQTLLEMTQQILSLLALGLESEQIDSPELPLLCDFLTVVPYTVESEEAGGLILQLDFAENLLEMLEIYQVSEETAMASLCHSFCHFIPGLIGIRVSIDGSPVEEPQQDESGQERGNLYLWKTSTVPVYDYATLYFCDEAGQLRSCLRPMPYRDCANPRKLLMELSKGPQEGDSVTDLLSVMPKGTITDVNLIGLSLQDSTMLVNFSPAFVNACSSMSAAEEKLFVYAMVNTLCENSSAKSVAFFRAGKQFDGFSGDICWKGVFYPLP